MSIVEAALQRLKHARAAEPKPIRARAPEPEPEETTPAARARPHMPEPVRWPARLTAADFDFDRLEAAGLYPPERCARRLRDEYRGIRREVLSATAEKVAATGRTVGPIVVVTSAGPGEGKSYTALNLALSTAAQGVCDVLLVDTDTVKRTITRACNLGDRPGLTELLAQPGGNFLEYACPTLLPRLHVLPAGTRAPAGAAHELFAPARVGPLFDSIRAALAEHVVIVDTPPLLVSSDTPVILDVAGQVLLVVRAGNTLQDGAREALDRIHKNLPVGVILNDWSPLLPSEKRTYTSYEKYAR
ncbi:MAG: protein tyrosine kinase [Steroidobacteraceae bacterium]|jgi:protein-tyrosine kinase